MARLEVGAVQNRYAVGPLVEMLIDFLGNVGGFAPGLQCGKEFDRMPRLFIRPEHLSLPVEVVGDDTGGGVQDGLSRPVVLLQLDDGGSRKVGLKIQDVLDISPPKAVDRLIFIPNCGDVLMNLGEILDQFILGTVGVLIFVNQELAVMLSIPIPDLGIFRE